MYQDPKTSQDLGSAGSNIRDLRGSWILYFHFARKSWRSWIPPWQDHRGIMWISDIRTENRRWIVQILGYRKMPVDPVDLGLCTCKFSCDLESCSNYHLIDLADPQHASKCCLWPMAYLVMMQCRPWHHPLAPNVPAPVKAAAILGGTLRLQSKISWNRPMHSGLTRVGQGGG